MSGAIVLLVIAALAGAGWYVARTRAAGFTGAHSLPSQHGWHMALWIALPALAVATLWNGVEPGLIRADLLASPAARALTTDPLERSAILAEAAGLASGRIEAAFHPIARALAPIDAAARLRYGLAGLGLAIAAGLAGAAFAWSRVRPAYRARPRVERLVMAALFLASLIAILTTIGIVGSLLFEALRFFVIVSPVDFLFGTHWVPQDTGEGFGAIPLFWGTIFIGAIIAMIVAIPLGLMSAVYLTQYAPRATRAWMKPLLEILAGVPSVVYGYFAALSVAPAVRSLGLAIGVSNASAESALAAGLVMGVMIIPFVSSMADDSLAAVPQAMRDGSLAMGATQSETIRKVLIPAALPGIVGGVLLAVSRAIGETMIVVMAAGLAANLTANPFSSVTTVTTQIVQLLTGDQEFDSPRTLAAFALGLVLFIVTLALNIIALRVVKKYREAYD